MSKKLIFTDKFEELAGYAFQSENKLKKFKQSLIFEYETVERWQSIGDQFNLSGWLRDRLWQRQLYKSEVNIQTHFFFLGLFVKSIIRLVRLYIVFFLKKLLPKKSEFHLKKYVRLCYGVRDVEIEFSSKETDIDVECPPVDTRYDASDIIIRNGQIPTKIIAELYLGELNSTLLTFAKSFLNIRFLKPVEYTYFLKEVFDNHCLQMLLLARYLKRKNSIPIYISEGFPREKLIKSTLQEVIEVHNSPTFNFYRRNLFLENNSLRLRKDYTHKEKNNPKLKRGGFPIEPLTYRCKRIVLCCGVRQESVLAVKKFRALLINSLGFDESSIKLKMHPRSTPVQEAITEEKDDLFIVCTSTTYGVNLLLRKYKKIIYFMALKDFDYNPAPHLDIACLNSDSIIDIVRINLSITKL